MISVPAGDPLIRAITLCFLADLPVLLVGRHGVGKSELLQRAAERLGVAFLARDLSLLEPTDLTGMPRVCDDGKTNYAPPFWFPTSGKGLIVFEEVNRAPSYVRSPCYELLTRRRLNDYQLPAGWLPCAAINDPRDGYSGDELDPAFRSRFLNILVTPDVSAWLSWARQGGVHEQVLHFVQDSEGIFDDPDANPRAWAYASRFLVAWEQSERNQDLLAAGLTGLLPERWALAFIQAYLQRCRPLQPAEVIEAYLAHRASLRAAIEKGRLDLLAASVEALKRHLQPQRVYEAVVANANQKANVEAFFDDLPAELKRQVRAWLDQRGFHKLTVPARDQRGQP
jgi:MoxR-like ATPase